MQCKPEDALHYAWNIFVAGLRFYRAIDKLTEHTACHNLWHDYKVNRIINVTSVRPSNSSSLGSLALSTFQYFAVCPPFPLFWLLSPLSFFQVLWLFQTQDQTPYTHVKLWPTVLSPSLLLLLTLALPVVMSSNSDLFILFPAAPATWKATRHSPIPSIETFLFLFSPSNPCFGLLSQNDILAHAIYPLLHFSFYLALPECMCSFFYLI